MTAEERFWALVQKSDGCWEWQGAKDGSGYGYFSSGGSRVRAHRFSFTLANGPIPDGLLVCHHCDNPPCVRPDHLFLGTHTANNRDRDRKGRAAVLTPERARSLTARIPCDCACQHRIVLTPSEREAERHRAQQRARRAVR